MKQIKEIWREAFHINRDGTTLKLRHLEVSTHGRVRSSRTGKPITTYQHSNRDSKHSYTTFAAQPDGGRRRSFTVGRVTASTFFRRSYLPNFVVDHIDGNTMNNNLDNLRWLSNGDNIWLGNNQQENEE